MNADRHVVLIGLPGAGKTNIGRHLAKLLQRPFADADEQLELTVGCTISRLAHERGDDDLHRREGQTLTDLLGHYSALVISAPGAVELGHDNQAQLARSAVVVWIRGPIRLLAELGDPTHRPRLADGHHEALARLERELSATYEDVADHIVDIEPFHALDDEPKRTVARHILGLLTAGDLQGAVHIPTDDHDHPALPERELSAIYEDVADHIVDIEPFHALDDEPKRIITRRILALLADNGIHPTNPR
jgi:shikimate kinase